MGKKNIISVDHAREIAKRRLPKSVYSYLEGGTEDYITVRDNRAAFSDVGFMPNVGVQFDHHEMRTTVFGQELTIPIIISPAGFIRLAHRDAELGAAYAADAVGTAIGISTLSSTPIEAITALTRGPVWYQVYFAGGRESAGFAIERAKEAGCTALLVTVDNCGAAKREKVLRSGGPPTRIDLKNAIKYAPEMALRPRWLLDFLQAGFGLTVPNVRAERAGPPMSVAAASATMKECIPTWDDLAWIRELWPGPIGIKGVVRPDDARRAIDYGAEAVIVSNHGGFALDGVPGTLRCLPAIVDAVGSDAEVLLDGGIRRGSDVVKALALGARAVLIGRAYIWGLAAAGGDGARQVLEILRDEIDRTLSLLGCPSIHDLDTTYLDLPAGWPRRPV